MLRMRLVGLAAVAVLALSAIVVSAAAAAEPEFVKEGGSVVGQSITTTSGAGEMKAGSTIKITCTSDKSSGEISSSKTVADVTVKFEGCEAKEGSKKCKTGTSENGVITTNALEGKLVEVSGGTKVGLELNPESGSSYVLVYAKCLLVKETNVEGQIVGEVSPTESYSETGKLIYSLVEGEQAINSYKYEGKETKEAELKAFGFIGTPLKTEETVTFPGAKIKVTV